MDPVYRVKLKSFPAYRRIVLVLSCTSYNVFSILISYPAKFCSQSRIELTKKPYPASRETTSGKPPDGIKRPRAHTNFSPREFLLITSHSL